MQVKNKVQLVTYPDSLGGDLRSRALSKELDSSVLVTRKGFGHTSVGQGNACVDGIGEAFAVRLALPPEGTTCR